MRWKKCLTLVVTILFICLVEGSSNTNNNNSNNHNSQQLILRLRNHKTGTMERLLVTDPDSQCLQDVLGSELQEGDKCCVAGASSNDNNNNDNGLDMTDCISNLKLSNGAMLTLSSATAPTTQKMKAKVSTSKVGGDLSWEPFAHLSRRGKGGRRRGRSRVNSFGDYSSGSLHVVEAQPKGPIERMYMCQLGASQFQMHVSSPNKKNNTIKNRVGWLFGTVQEERVNKGKKKPPATSLSTPVYDTEMCQIVKVHATWAPPQQPSKDNDSYDATSLLTLTMKNTSGNGNDDSCSVTKRAIQIAQWLGLQPVGWIFSYNDNRMKEDVDDNKNTDEGGVLPITGRDVYVGATAQCHIMKNKLELVSSSTAEEKPRAWITAAMDAMSGATEIFQLSDVSVQMVHEGVIPSTSKNKRFIQTTKPISIVASPSPESKELDSVLCLVNTALLSHTGLYSGNSSGNVVNKKGFFTNAAKKRLSKLLMELQPNNHQDLLEELCNFPLLVALDRLLVAGPITGSKKHEDDPMEQLCVLVKQYARGHKKATKIPQNLQLLLKHALQ